MPIDVEAAAGCITIAPVPVTEPAPPFKASPFAVKVTLFAPKDPVLERVTVPVPAASVAVVDIVKAPPIVNAVFVVVMSLDRVAAPVVLKPPGATINPVE